MICFIVYEVWFGEWSMVNGQYILVQHASRFMRHTVKQNNSLLRLLKSSLFEQEVHQVGQMKMIR
jgi:hypothetical protein